MPALPVPRIKLLPGGRRVVSPPEDAEHPLGAKRRPLTSEISWIRVVRKLNYSTMRDDPDAPILTEDELRLLTSLLCCPLRPQLAVAWFSTCHAVHSASAEVVAALKAQHLAVGRLRDKLNRASQTSQFQSASWGSGSVNGALLVPSVASFGDVDRAHWTGSGLTATDCEAVGTLLCSGLMPLLSDLSLAHNPIGDEGARALFAQLEADALPVQWLSLASCAVGDAGLTSLANALERGALPRLRALKLQCNQFGAAGGAALGTCVGSGALSGLSQLCMNDNGLGDAEAFWAAMRPGAMAGLVQLYWYSAGLGDAGLAALARALGDGAMPALSDLFLQENAFGDEGLEALSVALGRRALPSLEQLRLEGNRFGDRGVGAMCLALRSGGLRSLRVISLSGSDFGAAGCGALTTALRVAACDPTVGGGVLPCLCNLEVPAAHARDWQLRAACDALGVRLQAGMM